MVLGVVGLRGLSQPGRRLSRRPRVSRVPGELMLAGHRPRFVSQVTCVYGVSPSKCPAGFLSPWLQASLSPELVLGEAAAWALSRAIPSLFL